LKVQKISMKEVEMANLTRFEPLHEIISLREAMDRLFNDAFTRPLSLVPDSRQPLVDIYQTKDEIVVKATVPGVKPEDIDVSITNDLLTIKGEFKEEKKIEEATYTLQEHQYGKFERALPLPVPVKTADAKATYKDGVLTLYLPKVEEVRPKTIKVNVK